MHRTGQNRTYECADMPNETAKLRIHEKLWEGIELLENAIDELLSEVRGLLPPEPAAPEQSGTKPDLPVFQTALYDLCDRMAAARVAVDEARGLIRRIVEE